MSISATKGCLNVCHRFASKRMAVGPDRKSNTPIINFNLFQVNKYYIQNAIYPLLAKSICLNLVLNKIKDIYC